MAPGGVEPPRTDSKSVALSAELRGPQGRVATARKRGFLTLCPASPGRLPDNVRSSQHLAVTVAARTVALRGSCRGSSGNHPCPIQTGGACFAAPWGRWGG